MMVNGWRLMVEVVGGGGEGVRSEEKEQHGKIEFTTPAHQF
jgi:hypothetical protein